MYTVYFYKSVQVGGETKLRLCDTINFVDIYDVVREMKAWVDMSDTNRITLRKVKNV